MDLGPKILHIQQVLGDTATPTDAPAALEALFVPQGIKAFYQCILKL